MRPGTGNYEKVVLQLELLRQLSQISGVEFAQRQQQTGQRLLRQGSQCGAVIAGSVHRGQHGVHAVGAHLQPGAAAAADVLDAQLVGGGEQGGELRPGPGGFRLLGQRFGVQQDAFDPQRLGGFLALCAASACSGARRTTAPTTANPCCCRMRTATAASVLPSICIRTLSWLS